MVKNWLKSYSLQSWTFQVFPYLYLCFALSPLFIDIQLLLVLCAVNHFHLPDKQQSVDIKIVVVNHPSAIFPYRYQGSWKRKPRKNFPVPLICISFLNLTPHNPRLYISNLEGAGGLCFSPATPLRNKFPEVNKRKTPPCSFSHDTLLVIPCKFI